MNLVLSLKVPKYVAFKLFYSFDTIFKIIPWSHTNQHRGAISIVQIHIKLLPNVFSIYFSIEEKQKTCIV